MFHDHALLDTETQTQRPGIVRVESEFARWAAAHVDEVALGFSSIPRRALFRDLDPQRRRYS